MKVIGITGGVGCGKSAVLDYLEKNYNCRILKSDEAAGKLEEPGGSCYEEVVLLLEEAKRPGDEILVPGDGAPFDRQEAARRMYRDAALRAKINAVVHPAVIRYIRDEIDREKAEQNYDYFFVEAALLIENGFLKFVDEMWYIYCSEETRRIRLKSSRGYTDAKIDAIMKTQLTEKEFRENCSFIVDNSGSIEEMQREIAEHLGK